MPAARAIAARRSFVWTFPGAPIRIDVSSFAIERLRNEALGSAEAETGGILLGVASQGEPALVRITDIQPAPAAGRALYTLSRPERHAFLQTVAELRAAGRPMAVGFYRSHRREGFSLDHQDMMLVRTCLTAPTDVVLLLRPEDDGSITAGFFFWDEGQISPDCFLTFPLDSEASHAEESRPAPEAAAAAGTRFGAGVLVGGLATGLLALGFVGGRYLIPREHPVPTPTTTIVEVPVAPPVSETWNPGLMSSGLRDRSLPPAPRGARSAESAPAPREERASEPAPAPAPQQVQPLRAFQSPPDKEAARTAVPAPPVVPVRSAAGYSEVKAEALAGAALPLPRFSAPENPARSGVPAAPPAVEAERYSPPQVLVQVQPSVPLNVKWLVTRPTQVQVNVTVDENGNVTAAQPAKSPDAVGNTLGALAADAAKRWRFKPAFKGTHPVQGNAILKFDFVPGRQ